MDYETEINSPKVRYWALRRLLVGEGYKGDSLTIVLDEEICREFGNGWHKPEKEVSLLTNGSSSIELKIDMFRGKQFRDITMHTMFLQDIIYVSKISMKNCDEELVDLVKEYLE